MGTHPIFESDFDCLTENMAEGSLEKGFILDPEARMQSRIDEQSELICILKKRADQLLHESKSAENRVRLMERTNADLVKQIRAEKGRCTQVELRFNELADNHQELIKFKNEYKATASQLRSDNDHLRAENADLMGPLITAKNDEIDRWQSENAALFERIARLESDNSHLNTRVVELTESSTVKSLRIDDLLGEISELNESQRRENADHCGQVAKMDEKTKIRQSHFDNEQRRMRTALETHESTIAAKNAELDGLRGELNALNAKLGSIETEWASAKGRLARDAAYRQLVEENRALQATLDEKERTFDAFTKHTRELIEKEKFLNKRLRAYSLQMPAASSTSDNAVDK